MSEHADLIARYYDHDPEHEWKRADRHRTEFSLTMKALEEHLPPPPARILDCGGGPGRLAIELAQRGYDVTLFDLSAGNLNLARRKATEAGVELAAYEQGTAVDLGRFDNEAFDAVLLLGPLYHLLNSEERLRSIAECKRVLKPGGVLFAAFICRYAGFRDLATTHPEWIVPGEPFLEMILQTGNLPPRGFEEYEFIAHFVHPDQVADTLWQSDLEVRQVIGLEGLVSRIEDGVNQTSDEVWEHWVALNHRVGKDPSTWGGAEHLLGIAIKPAWKSALRRIAHILNEAGVEFKVVGGACAALHGVRIPFKDLDLEMSGEAAHRFQELFPAQILEPVGLSESPAFRSHYGAFDIDGVRVEVMGDLERRQGEGWEPTWTCTRALIDLEGQEIPVSWLEEEMLAYIRRGRLDRAAACLLKCDQAKLLQVLRGEQEIGVI